MNQLCFTRAALNSFVTDKPVALGFLIELKFRIIGFCGGRKTREPGLKNIQGKDENQQQTQPSPGIEPRPH